MKSRLPFVIGAAVGYVLGTRAGRERYEQIKQASQRMAGNPTVQETTEALKTRAGEIAGSAKEKVDTRLHDSRIGNRLHRSQPSGTGEPVPPRQESGTGTPM
ncbi:YtxH domain-containing protein [Actinomadura craniellae]|uniref:YtxH domain-containing protein n=1 Tax=Actinomadura craniellae TaxID=2231787 RepID=A0A365GZ51_9ACTN|nr:YtxH domain-containing protein [Actinomadura craniellae]RAY12110.1 YtxH domain-containing protein [Actinomadura craniellae]